MERLVRLPQDRLAYYGFKIFKTLLPYLGRKWRQGWLGPSQTAATLADGRLTAKHCHAETQSTCGW